MNRIESGVGEDEECVGWKNKRIVEIVGMIRRVTDRGVCIIIKGEISIGSRNNKGRKDKYDP